MNLPNATKADEERTSTCVISIITHYLQSTLLKVIKYKSSSQVLMMQCFQEMKRNKLSEKGFKRALLTPSLLFVRSAPNCAEPAVSTILPLYGGDISCTTRGFVSTDTKTEQNSISAFTKAEAFTKYFTQYKSFQQFDYYKTTFEN